MKSEIPFWLKTTPLYELLKEAGGQFVEFAGYFMPVNFSSGIVFEHQTVRNQVGFFDISHMGEISLKGRDASKFLNYVSTNNIDKIKDNQMQYQILCHEDGGVVDDMMAYKFSESDILLVCNASNKDKVYQHLLSLNSGFDLEINDVSDEYSAIALQGPKAIEAIKLLANFSDLNFLEFSNKNDYLVSRSGYTGEDGFEIYGSSSNITELVKTLLDNQIEPIGLGARDTLRFEAGLPLYGHELADFISPIQAGLSFAIDFNKDDFIGKKALLEQKTNPESKIYGLELIDRGIARQGYQVFKEDQLVGFITSGFMIPGTKNSFANALLEGVFKLGEEVEIEIRNKRVKAIIRKKKYIDKNYKIKGERKWDIILKRKSGF